MVRKYISSLEGTKKNNSKNIFKKERKDLILNLQASSKLLSFSLYLILSIINNGCLQPSVSLILKFLEVDNADFTIGLAKP